MAPSFPVSFKLEQNYPNPFNPQTHIKYDVAKTGPVNLSVYNVAGQRIRTLVNKVQERGNYRVTFSGEGLASGVYFYRLQTGRFVETRKMILTR
jgi:hypothetical protein